MNDERTLLKQATLRLVKKVGGVEAAEGVLGYSKTSISNAYSLNHDCTMPMPHVLTLEQYVGVPVVTRELARMQGFDLTPSDGQMPRETDLNGLLLRIYRETGEATTALQDRNHFDSTAEFHLAKREAVDVLRAAERLVDEVRRRDPGKNAPLRAVS